MIELQYLVSDPYENPPTQSLYRGCYGCPDTRRMLDIFLLTHCAAPHVLEPQRVNDVVSMMQLLWDVIRTDTTQTHNIETLECH